MRAVSKKASSGTEEIFGARKQPPGVRDAFSEALGVKNRLLWYRSDIRYRKPHFLVPNRHRCTKTPSSGPECIFRGTQQPLKSLRAHRKIGLLHKQKADSATLQAAKGLLE